MGERAIFEEVKQDRHQQVNWEQDHVACMVDKLGPGGHTEAATKLVEEYCRTGRRPSISSKDLLGACSMHGDLRLGKEVNEDLLTADSSNKMVYMLLSILYSASAPWKEAEIVRKAMVEKGLKRKPGCSWIQVRY